MERGLIHVYFGDGKGKTSAAFGLAARALGSGLSVYVAQFLKSEGSGELETLKHHERFDSARLPTDLKFYFAMTERQRADYKAFAKKMWESATKRVADVIILDEVIDAIDLAILDINSVVEFLKSKPSQVELVLTGHKPLEALIDLADYVTEFKAHKHPYNSGIKARKGIEY